MIKVRKCFFIIRTLALCFLGIVSSAQESVYITKPKASLRKQSDKPIVRSEPLGKPTSPVTLTGTEDGAAVVTSQGERHELKKSETVFQNRSKASAPAAKAEPPAVPKEAKPADEPAPKEDAKDKPAEPADKEQKPAEKKDAPPAEEKAEPAAKDEKAANGKSAEEKKEESPEAKAEKEQIKKELREGLKRLDKEGGVFIRDENDQPVSREEFEKLVEAGKADKLKITDYRQDAVDLLKKGEDEPASEPTPKAVR